MVLRRVTYSDPKVVGGDVDMLVVSMQRDVLSEASMKV